MAEGSRDQGSVSTADPEEDSPNMIVYRKVRPTLRSSTKKDSSANELGCVFPPPLGGANAAPPVLLITFNESNERSYQCQGCSPRGCFPARPIFWDGFPTGEMLVISPIPLLPPLLN